MATMHTTDAESDLWHASSCTLSTCTGPASWLISISFFSHRVGLERGYCSSIEGGATSTPPPPLRLCVACRRNRRDSVRARSERSIRMVNRRHLPFKSLQTTPSKIFGTIVEATFRRTISSLAGGWHLIRVQMAPRFFGSPKKVCCNCRVSASHVIRLV
ncbi:hypothetical protein BCV70DRAFT_94760 [Testicularia cyperi]|uniref:Uncharacterized protein n=1 Tax=Testicularia cyperi TaxID=1882483 RepID=A0A317XQ09_9BASI|nr:hypothetical protein BCV70DRAFT_94760 [Testicularia cyperi]